ncbi:unnamed protein product, partial [Clonostachys rhizophaga]
MVHNERLAPLGAVWPWLVCAFADTSTEEEVVNLVRADLGKGFGGERLDGLEVVQLEREDAERVQGAIVFKRVKGILSALEVTGTNNDLVRLGLLQKLLDHLKALGWALVGCWFRRMGQRLKIPGQRRIRSQ